MEYIDTNQLIPTHQYGFRQHHSTIQQVHRIINEIESSLEMEQVCSVVFLDIAQAFDKVCHEGLKYKLRKLLPTQFSAILTNYIGGRMFRVRQGNDYSALYEIRAGVPQGSVLGPLLFLLYTSDIPIGKDIYIATFADDTALFATGKSVEESTRKLQQSCNLLVEWTNRWSMKLNESKSIHVNFTNKIIREPPRLYLNGIEVPIANTAKYLGMTLDARLRWKEHIKIKKNELQLKYNQIQWLLGAQSKMSVENKLLIYKQILKPIWLYGVQLWGCAKASNKQLIQTFQNKVLRKIVDAPWYIRNADIHKDLNIPTINEEISNYALKHYQRLESHLNPTARQLSYEDVPRRLRRTKPCDLCV